MQHIFSDKELNSFYDRIIEESSNQYSMETWTREHFKNAPSDIGNALQYLLMQLAKEEHCNPDKQIQTLDKLINLIHSNVQNITDPKHISTVIFNLGKISKQPLVRKELHKDIPGLHYIAKELTAALITTNSSSQSIANAIHGLGNLKKHELIQSVNSDHINILANTLTKADPIAQGISNTLQGLILLGNKNWRQFNSLITHKNIDLSDKKLLQQIYQLRDYVRFNSNSINEPGYQELLATCDRLYKNTNQESSVATLAYQGTFKRRLEPNNNNQKYTKLPRKENKVFNGHC